jgi:ferric-dicitrate binding protein FerR (iron transport regulator)
MEKEDYIRRWIEGSLDEEERKNFEKTEAYKSLHKISESLRAFRAPEYPVEEEWSRLAEQKPGRSKTNSVRWIQSFTRIAAVLVILFGIYYLFFHDTRKTIRTNTAENKALQLPDSSSVILNAQSVLSYSSKNWLQSREVNLNGEAYFTVTHGTRFEVITPTGTIQVIGTQFNVKNRPDYFEVICYEGLVQVESAGEVVELPPHYMYRVLNGQATRSDNLQENNPGWIRDESSFHSVPFNQVIQEFERQYDVTITLRNVDKDQLFTGRFVNSDMDLALQSITIPLNLRYQIEKDQKIVLSGNPD